MEAAAFSRKLSGRGLTRQSFAIFNKIAQVDAAVSTELQERVFEVHPELSFWAAAGRRHLKYPKRTAAAFDERRPILEAALPGVVIPRRVNAARLLRDVAADDLLDAAVGAWSAFRHSRQRSERIPNSREFDGRGLRMEMIY